MAKARETRRYSPLEHERAVRRAREVGPHVASEELGIPASTISTWQSQARKQASAESGPPKASDSAVVEPAAGALTETAASPAAPAVPAPATKQKPSGRGVAKAYTPSERARALECAAQEGVSAAALKFGISRFSLYEWQRRTALHAQGKIANSPVVGSDEDRGAARDHRILSEWKAHPGLGPSQVRNQLRRQGFKVSVHTVRCVLDENGYVTPKVRREPASDQRYEAVRPNHLWHLDFLHRHIHKQKIFLLLVLEMIEDRFAGCPDRS